MNKFYHIYCYVEFIYCYHSLATGPPPPLPPRPVIRQNICDDVQLASKPNIQSKILEEVAKTSTISADTKNSELKLNLDNKTETSSTTSRRSSFSSTIVRSYHCKTFCTFSKYLKMLSFQNYYLLSDYSFDQNKRIIPPL